MPYYKKKTKKVFRKKPKKTYRSRRRRTSLVSMGVPSGMPTARRANLRYCQIMYLTSSAGTLGSDVFRANSIYDPDFTGSGHQPMGHDQWTALFNHYVVLGSKMTAQCTSNTGSIPPTGLGIYLTDSTTVPYTSTEDFVESRKGQSKMSGFGQETAIKLSCNYSAKKFYNIVDVKDNLLRIGSASGANPTDQALFVLWAQALDGTTHNYRILVTIDFIVEFSEPVDLTGS